MRVSAVAKRMSEMTPRIVQPGCRPERNQLQKAKHPAISKNAATKKRAIEFNAVGNSQSPENLGQKRERISESLWRWNSNLRMVTKAR